MLPTTQNAWPEKCAILTVAHVLPRVVRMILSVRMGSSATDRKCAVLRGLVFERPDALMDSIAIQSFKNVLKKFSARQPNVMTG
jgi:hypothetical protein